MLHACAAVRARACSFSARAAVASWRGVTGRELAGGHRVALAPAHAAVDHGARQRLCRGALEADHDAAARRARPARVRAVRQARPRRAHLLLPQHQVLLLPTNLNVSSQVVDPFRNSDGANARLVECAGCRNSSIPAPKVWSSPPSSPHAPELCSDEKIDHG